MNCVEEGVDATGFHRGMVHHHPAHVLTHAHMEAIWVEQHATHPVATVLLLLARAHGIVLLEAPYQAQCAIHKAVMGLELHAHTHALLEDPSVVLRATFPQEHRLIIRVLLEDLYLDPLAHSLHQELRNMDVPMEEHKAAVYVSCPQDNV